MTNPILKVLSSLNQHRATYLLMGGQACVFYGAAEFSRDTDIAVLAESVNLERLSVALAELQAECIALPPFSADYLERGHAVHFRCQHPDAAGMRIDVMAVMRGVAPFAGLWQRRTTVEDDSGIRIEVISLPDLVQAKKTQRDKDWPMIRRLVEANYVQHRQGPTAEQVEFWLRECRTLEILVELAEKYPQQTTMAARERPLLSLAASRNTSGLVNALDFEEKQQREVDRLFWLPLKSELEELRLKRPKRET